MQEIPGETPRDDRTLWRRDGGMSLTVIVFMESETLRRLSMELSNAAMAPGSGAMQLNDTLSGRGDTRNGAGDDGSAPWRKRRSSPLPWYILRMASERDRYSACLRSLILKSCKSRRILAVVSRRRPSQRFVNPLWGSEKGFVKYANDPPSGTIPRSHIARMALEGRHSSGAALGSVSFLAKMSLRAALTVRRSDVSRMDSEL